MDPNFPILTTLIAVPFAGALLVLLTPTRRPEVARIIGYAVSAAVAGLAAWILFDFSTTTHALFQRTENHTWIHSLGIHYTLGIDGISLFMVLLTALLFPIALLASANTVTRLKSFVFWMLFLEGSLMGVFLSLDLMLFFIFFELVLVPMYFIISGWGSDPERRVKAALKFFVYTMTGSAFLFVGILAVAFLHAKAGHPLTFDYVTLRNWAPKGLAGNTATWLFVAFGVAFAVKVPLFPLHTWLPDAHTEAPTAGSVILAGVLLKMGTYGFLRFSLGLFPKAAVDLSWLLLVLATIGIVYGAIVAAMQTDLKRLVAYSSVAHMGFVVLGIFALNTEGIDGALFTMISHGLTTGALFLLVGMLYERRHTREISNFGGLWKSVPIFGGLFLATAFASIGLPGFSGFIGEFLALLGTFLTHRPYAIIAAVGVILAALYLLWAYQRAFTGEPDEENEKIPDLNLRELACVVPLLALSLFLGFYPKPVLEMIEPSVKAVVTHVNRTGDHRPPVIATPKPASPLKKESR